MTLGFLLYAYVSSLPLIILIVMTHLKKRKTEESLQGRTRFHAYQQLILEHVPSRTLFREQGCCSEME